MPISPINLETIATHIYWKPRAGQARSAIAYREPAGSDAHERRMIVEVLTDITDEGADKTTRLEFKHRATNEGVTAVIPRSQLRRLAEALANHADDLDAHEADSAVVADLRHIEGQPFDTMYSLLDDRGDSDPRYLALREKGDNLRAAFTAKETANTAAYAGRQSKITEPAE